MLPFLLFPLSLLLPFILFIDLSTIYILLFFENKLRIYVNFLNYFYLDAGCRVYEIIIEFFPENTNSIFDEVTHEFHFLKSDTFDNNSNTLPKGMLNIFSNLNVSSSSVNCLIKDISSE